MKSLFVVALVLFLAISSASAAQNELALGRLPSSAAGGKAAPLGRLAGTNELHLAITLPLHDEAGLTNFLHDLYTPGNPFYHHYLKPGEFADRFGPTRADYEAVKQFVAANGLCVERTHSSRLTLDVAGQVTDVERVFHVHVKAYRRSMDGRIFFAPDANPTPGTNVPIGRVVGLDNLAEPEPFGWTTPIQSPGGGPIPCDGSGPGGTLAGTDFRQAYVPGTALDGTGQSIALVQFDTFYPDDITNYYTTYTGRTNVPNVVVVPVDGGISSPGPNVDEVSLDIEMCLAMAPGISNIYVYEAPQQPTSQSMIDMLTQIAEDDNASQVSCSWGVPDEHLVFEQAFLQMAAQGQTFFNASGDMGAFHNPVGYPIRYPCESPNITLVGGTALTTDGSSNYVAETVWNNNTNGPYASAGGISPHVPIPSWQLGLDLRAACGSTQLRNIPDVALTSSNVFILYGEGIPGSKTGTSCAAPLWAGFMALVNQQANQAGQPAMGFLNPAIYALCRGTNYPSIFHDIVTGNNTNNVQPTNYLAVPGYDLCTGWGTPNGTNLINLLTAPDNLGVSPVNFTFSGPFGGPFFPPNQNITLTNSGPMSLNWAIGTNVPWLGISASSGALPAHGSTNIGFQYGVHSPGCYTGVIYLTNLVLNSVKTLDINIQVDPSILLNGGFESGDFTNWTFVGDYTVGNQHYNAVWSDIDFVGVDQVVHGGLFGAYLAEQGTTSSLSQVLPTTPGQQYRVSFWLDEEQGTGGVQTFAMNWGGTNIFGLTNSMPFGWTNYQFMVTAMSTNTELEFVTQNDPGYFGFDDVSVTPVPQLTLSGIAYTNGNAQLIWPAVQGADYEVIYTTNLATGGWQVLGNVVAPTNVSSLVDSNILSGDRQRYYRLVLP